MSNRDSLGFGDLLPQDVVDIFAQEKLNKKGRKQRSRSLGRALTWLKGKKNKNVERKAQNPGLGPAFDLALESRPAGHQGTPKGSLKSGKQGHQQSNSHAVPKRDDSDEKTPAPIVLQENVFIEVSRPKYLEDLHSEALEGLKLMQQEERIIGPEYHDNASTISTVSARAEVDGGGFTTDSTIPDTSSTVSVRSSVSSRSSRSGLTRQGSTFRPLNSGKKSEKGRTRRRHRKTIAGIPQHLQREFGLDRAEWTVGPHLEEEFVNGDSDVPQLAVHSPPEANTEVVHPLISVQEELSAAQSVHVDDLALLQRLGPSQAGGDRPWSLAVPGMTTAGNGQSGPPSPVMSMSPQAAYLSKIIPNAVLPPSIDVVEISRGSSRNSVRTVSKSSLVLSSPTSSRASSRASTARSTSSRSSTITSASRQNHFHLSDSSCWSNSDSDTLVSDSSTISSSSTPRQRDAQDRGVSKKQNKVSVHTGSPKHPSNGKIMKGNELKKDGPFVRSLSVMKPKRAPPPPSRSYSLHNKMKRRSRDLADIKIITSPTSEENMKKRIDSPGYNADTSSLDESSGSKTPSPLKPLQSVDLTQNNVSTDLSNAKTEALQASNNIKVVSPSSGYSSQDATSPKKSSPKHKKGLLAKLHKLFPTATTAPPSTSSVTQPEASKSAPVITDKPSVKALKELFSIPPHPKVQAPPPPPPEVWSHSPRSVELLLGPPASGNTYAIVKKNPKDKRPYRPPASTNTEVTVRVEEQKQSNIKTVESKKVHVSQEGSLNVANRTKDCERLIQRNIDVKDHGKVQVSEILNSVLVRTVDRDTDRLPAIAEEHKTITQNVKNPSISPAHISPRLPTKQTVPTVIALQKISSPESSWPPPPPPVSLGSPDETDLPLPPPPVFTEAVIVHPAQVPPDKIVSVASNVSTSIQDNKPQPLNIPPPPNYTAPPPPNVKRFTPQTKDVSPPPSKITLLPPKQVVLPPKISKLPVERPPSTSAQLNKDSIPAEQKSSAIPAPPPPSQKLLLDIISSKIIYTPAAKPTLSSNSEVHPPPDLIPPTPTKEMFVVVPSIVADLPTPSHSQASIQQHNKVLRPTEEPAESTSSTQLLITKTEPEIITQPKDFPSPPPVISKLPSERVPPPDPIVVLSPSQVPKSPSEAAPPVVAVEVALVPPEVSNPPPEKVSTQVEVAQTPAEIPIPQPEAVSEPLVEEISRSQEVPAPVEMSIPIPICDLSAQQPKVVQSEKLPPTDVSLTTVVHSPAREVTPTPPEEILPSPKEAPTPEIVVKIAGEPQVIVDPAPSVVEERFLPVVVEVSYPELSEETSTDVLEEEPEESQKPPQEKDKSPPNNDSGPKSEEPVAEKEVKHSKQEILTEKSTGTAWKSILTPPQSIPPPPPIEQPASDTVRSNEPNQPEEIPSQSEPPKSDQIPAQPEVPPPTESTSTQEEAKTSSVPVSSSPIEVVLTQETVSDTAEQPSEQPAEAPTVEEVAQNVDSQEDTILTTSTIEQVSKQEPPAEQSSETPANTVEDVSPNANSKEDTVLLSSPIEEVPKQEPASETAEKQIEALAVKELSQNTNIQEDRASPAPIEEVPIQEPTSETAEKQIDTLAVKEESQNANSQEDTVKSAPIEENLKQELPSETAEKQVEALPVKELSQNANIQEETASPAPNEEVPKQEPAADTAEKQIEEPADAPTVEEVSQNMNYKKDEAVNGSPESAKTEDEVKPKENKDNNQTSPTTEAPQKPIRRSLVISPPSSPPATVTTQPTVIKVPSPNTTVPTTTTTRSPPAMAPSMNLQEAIRLRTAARSHNGPSSRFGLHSPPGFDVRKSPTSTASFIFSKSSKKVVIETKSEAKVERKTTAGSVTKPQSAELTMKKEFKVPPPVAKKPKTKSKEVESGEQTAGQEAHSDAIKDITKKPNGTAVEGH